MKNLLAVAAISLFAGVLYADSVVISNTTPTPIVSTGMFNNKTIAIQVQGAGLVFLNSQPIALPATFAANSFAIGNSSGIIVLPNFHGTIYGEASQAGAPITLTYLGGQ